MTIMKNSSTMLFRSLLFFLAGAFSLTAQNFPGDEALSKVLIDGEDWKLVADGFGFTDAACADAQGNFYFSDLSKGVVHVVSPAGEVARFLENGPKISGLKF